MAATSATVAWQQQQMEQSWSAICMGLYGWENCRVAADALLILEAHYSYGTTTWLPMMWRLSCGCRTHYPVCSVQQDSYNEALRSTNAVDILRWFPQFAHFRDNFPQLAAPMCCSLGRKHVDSCPFTVVNPSFALPMGCAWRRATVLGKVQIAVHQYAAGGERAREL